MFRELFRQVDFLRGTRDFLHKFGLSGDAAGSITTQTGGLDLTGHQRCDISQNGSSRGKLDRFAMRQQNHSIKKGEGE